jgi:hypothetical protein
LARLRSPPEAAVTDAAAAVTQASAANARPATTRRTDAFIVGRESLSYELVLHRS